MIRTGNPVRGYTGRYAHNRDPMIPHSSVLRYSCLFILWAIIMAQTLLLMSCVYSVNVIFTGVGVLIAVR